jgi:hypothetical protein
VAEESQVLEGRECGWPVGLRAGLTWVCAGLHVQVTTLGVYKALGIIVGFWQKAMELKSLRMAFKEKNPH